MATVNIRLDENLKKEAFSVLDELGLSPSDFIRGMFQYVAKQKRLPVKFTAYDLDNFEASHEVWQQFIPVRDSGRAVIQQLGQDKNIAQTVLAEFFSAIDRFHQTTNSESPRLVKNREWTQINLELQKLSYQLKYQALSSRLGSDYAMYASEAINEFSKSFYGLEYLAHELMLNSRTL